MAKTARTPPVDLVPSGRVERHLETRLEAVLGPALPLIAAAPFEASAAAGVRLAARAFAGAPTPAIFAP
jgi:hypothetical protein